MEIEGKGWSPGYYTYGFDFFYSLSDMVFLFLVSNIALTEWYS